MMFFVVTGMFVLTGMLVWLSVQIEHISKQLIVISEQLARLPR